VLARSVFAHDEQRKSACAAPECSGTPIKTTFRDRTDNQLRAAARCAAALFYVLIGPPPLERESSHQKLRAHIDFNFAITDDMFAQIEGQPVIIVRGKSQPTHTRGRYPKQQSTCFY
jgi:hypothetical protein